MTRQEDKGLATSPLARWDLDDLRRDLRKRAALVVEAKRGLNTAGATRPARDPAERAWLEEDERRAGPFRETDKAFRARRARRRESDGKA